MSKVTMNKTITVTQLWYWLSYVC